ncbi:MAG TPA: hypothetical protein VFW73_11275 [Lacipirellulaceae bacterium]|nr:hypothetical protein [Lacipirellulaceae bacterium]
MLELIAKAGANFRTPPRSSGFSTIRFFGTLAEHFARGLEELNLTDQLVMGTAGELEEQGLEEPVTLP